MSMQTTSQSEPMRIGMVKKPVPALTMEVVSVSYTHLRAHET